MRFNICSLKIIFIRSTNDSVQCQNIKEEAEKRASDWLEDPRYAIRVRCPLGRLYRPNNGCHLKRNSNSFLCSIVNQLFPPLRIQLSIRQEHVDVVFHIEESTQVLERARMTRHTCKKALGKFVMTLFYQIYETLYKQINLGDLTRVFE